MDNITAFGRNIRFQPMEKDRVIGDTAKYLLCGKVLAVGSEVKNIKVGMTIEYTQWGLNKTIMPDGNERFYILEDDDLILNAY